MLSQEEIRSLIPHAGRMCLLERVESWDDETILCQTNSHRAPDNPLRRNHQLSAIHAFEYGAQAAAIHGGLRARAADDRAPLCYLAALRDARVHLPRLDNIENTLSVTAHRLFGDAGNTVYEISVTSSGRPIAEGRVTIIQRSDS